MLTQRWSVNSWAMTLLVSCRTLLFDFIKLYTFASFFSPLSGSTGSINSQYGRTNDTVHLTNVGCSGNEKKLGDCVSTRLDVNDASNYPTVAGVNCIGTPTITLPSSTPMSMSSMSSSMSPSVTPSVGLSSGNSSSAIVTATALLGVITLLLIVIAVM